MALDPAKNFADVIVSTGYDDAATSVALRSGDGAKLPDPGVSGAFNLVWWNATNYSNPADDPNVEIVRCTARSTDTLTISRAQESTSAATHNTVGKTYRMILGITKKMIDDIEANKVGIGQASGSPARGDMLVAKTATPTWEKLTLGGAGKILRSDGTDLVYSTLTIPDTIAQDNLFYSSGANVLAAASITAAGRALIDDANAAAQRTTLGLVIGTNVQAYDATLLSIAALGTGADKMAYATGVDTWAETGLTAFGRSIIDDANEAAFKATVNLEIGVDVQAYGAVLDDLNTLGAAASDGQFIVATGAGAFAYEAGSTARDSLALGTSNAPQFARIGLGAAADGTIPVLSYQNPASTNTSLCALKIERLTTGTAATGLGASIDFYLEDDNGDSEFYAGIAVVTTDATNNHATLTLQLSQSATAFQIEQVASTTVNTIIGHQVAVPTNFNDGFLYIPTSAGVPTGAPTGYTGKVALHYDTANNDIYVYNGAWRKVAVA